jgi:hypothetical protein
LLGGIIGAAGSYLYGGKLLEPALKIASLQNGLQKVTYGPVQDSQFAYVVLGRAVDHWWHISNRNHAGRDLLALAPTDKHWIEGLNRESRRTIQKTLEKCRKQDHIDVKLLANLQQAIEQCLITYKQWRE